MTDIRERLHATPEYLELESGLREADRVLQGYFRRPEPPKIQEKESIHSILLEADLASEQVLLKLLKGKTVLSEETPTVIETGDFWIIDPLDGTAFFADGLKDWSVTLAHAKDGKIELGMTYVPGEDEMFYAKVGLGAYLNGRRIRVSEKREIKNALVAVDAKAIRGDTSGNIRTLISDSRALWVTGSTARALAYLAIGRVDAAIHKEQSIWDIAAGMVLIREAGGLFTSWRGGVSFDLSGAKAPQNSILATNGYLHGFVIEYLSLNQT